MSRDESQKKGAYLQRVVSVERGAFTPLVFSTNGLCERECLRALKNLVRLIVMRHSGLQYSLVMNHLLRSKMEDLFRFGQVVRHLFPRLPGLIFA